jgi:hypothetical protein
MEKIKVNFKVSEKDMATIELIQKEELKKGNDLSIDEIITKLLEDGIRVIKKEVREKHSLSTSPYKNVG